MELTTKAKTDSQKKECTVSYVEALKRIESSPLKALGFGSLTFTTRKPG